MKLKKEGEIEREANCDSNKTDTPIKQQLGSGNVTTTDTGNFSIYLTSILIAGLFLASQDN